VSSRNAPLGEPIVVLVVAPIVIVVVVVVVVAPVVVVTGAKPQVCAMRRSSRASDVPPLRS